MFVLFSLVSCSTKTVYVDKPYEVLIPVKCEVPDVYCDFNKTTDTEVIGSLLECITNLKRSVEVCR